MNFGATENHTAIVNLAKTLKIIFDCSVMQTCISVIEILADIMTNYYHNYILKIHLQIILFYPTQMVHTENKFKDLKKENTLGL